MATSSTGAQIHRRNAGGVQDRLTAPGAAGVKLSDKEIKTQRAREKRTSENSCYCCPADQIFS